MELAALKEQLRQKDEEAKKAAAAGMELLKQNRQLTEENDSLKQQCHSLNTQLEQAENLQQIYSGDMSTLYKQLDANEELLVEFESLKLKHRDLTAENNALRAELKHKEAALDETLESLAVLNRQLLELKEFNLLNKAEKDEVIERLYSSRRHVKGFDKETATLTANLQFANEEIDKLRRIVADQQDEIMAKNDQLDSCEQKLEASAKHCTDLRRVCTETEDALKAANAELDRIKQSNAEQLCGDGGQPGPAPPPGTSVFSELDDRRRQVERKLTAVEKLNAELRANNERLALDGDLIRRECSVQLDHYRKLMMSKMSSFDKFVKISLMEANERLADKVRELETTRSKLVGETAKQNGRNQQNMNETDEQVLFLRELLNAANEEIVRLNRCLSMAEKKEVAARVDVGRLQTKFLDAFAEDCRERRRRLSEVLKENNSTTTTAAMTTTTTTTMTINDENVEKLLVGGRFV